MSCITQHLLLRSAHRLSRTSRRATLVRSGARIGNLASKGRWPPHCAVPVAAASTSSADAPWLFVGLGNPGAPPVSHWGLTQPNLLFSVWLVADAAYTIADVQPGLNCQPYDLTASGTPLLPHLLPAGRNYDGTRHNVGFAAIDELGLQAGIELKKVELNAILGRGR